MVGICAGWTAGREHAWSEPVALLRSGHQGGEAAARLFKDKTNPTWTVNTMQCPICLSESDESTCPVCGYSKSEQSVGPQAPPVQPVVFTPPPIPVVEKPSPIPDPPLAPSPIPTEPSRVSSDYAASRPEPSEPALPAYPPPPPLGADVDPLAQRVGADPGPQIPPPGASHGAPAPRSPWLIPGLTAAAVALVVLIAAIAWPHPVSTASEPSPVATQTVTKTATAPAEAPTIEAPPSQEPVTEEATADTGDATLVDERFSEGDLPEGWVPESGDWEVVDGRLQATTDDSRARIEFGPAAPDNYRIEAQVTFVDVLNDLRWLNIGLDYHVAADWGALLVVRSDTTAENGVELAQRVKGGPKVYVSDPVGPASSPVGVGEDHWVQVEVHGRNYEVSIDGDPVLSGDNLRRTGGGFGFVINNSTVQFDNVTVTELNE